MDSCTEGAPEPEFVIGVRTPNAGVASESLPAGTAAPGVEACNVANKSGAGEEATGRLHPTVKNKKPTMATALSLFIIQFD
jgi:hypothetical protein